MKKKNYSLHILRFEIFPSLANISLLENLIKFVQYLAVIC